MKTILTYTLIALTAVMMAIGCNSEKRATKHLYKAVRINPDIPLRYCADNYKGVDSVHEKIVYKAGAVKYDTVVETQLSLVNDTVYKTQVKYVTKYQVDTVELSRFEREQNEARITLLNNQADSLKGEINLHIVENKTLAAKYNSQLNQKLWTWAIVSLYIILKFFVGWLSKQFPKNIIVKVFKLIF